ncbi:hypothetical protein PAHAL_2G054300 [Panicum hallii]|uniref:Uncharacterized protein n=1 Tax=Panicum hallii TaxID=206008 RepID=A0A2T8KN38_9POAL|nr:hypothetical protein PAHAL_2G054300 [Panicum hallii]
MQDQKFIDCTRPNHTYCVHTTILRNSHISLQFTFIFSKHIYVKANLHMTSM